MTIRELIKKLKDNKIDLSLDGDDLEINFDGDELPDDLLEEIRSNKSGIIDFLKQVYGLDVETDQVIPLVPEQESYEMSPTQRRSWLVSQFSDSDIAYNMPMTFVLEGKLSIESLNYALKQQPLRHESLRTAFRADEHGEVRQYILKPEEVDFTIREVDLRQHPDKLEEVKRLVKKEMSTSIDLTSGVLMRAVLFQLEDNQWTFHLTAHHIITDSWAMNMMIAELFLYYNIHNAGKGHPLPPLRIQQKDYVAWKLTRMKGDGLQRHKDYWIKEFSGDIPKLSLPSDKPRPAIKTFHGEAVSKLFSPQLTKDLRTLCQEHGASLFMGIMTGLNALFNRYANQDDILMGIPVAGRDNPELHNQMGFFAFTLVIRTQFSANDTFRQLLENVRQKVLNAYEHQEFPFDDLVEELDLKRDMSRSLLFDTFVVMQMAGDMVSSGAKEEQMADDLSVFKFPDEDKPYTAFDMSINFSDAADQLFVRLEYNCDIYTRPTAIRMLDHLGQIFEAFVSTPDKALKDLDIISPEEKNQILVEFNQERPVQVVKKAGEKTILDLLDEQLQKAPLNPAIVYEDKILTYDELNEKANQLGALLKKVANTHSNETIAIKLERSEWMLIAMLAVLKSGASCLPIAPDTSAERLNYLITTGACKMMLDDAMLEQLKPEMDKYSKANLPPLNKATDAAFVIFGNGDKPKMHRISHKNIIDFYARMVNPAAKDQSAITAFSSYAFELSVVEMIGGLTLGAKVIISKGASNQAINISNEFNSMDFSLFYFGNLGNEKNKYEILMNAAKYGDKNGYTAIWTPERHFHIFGGPYPCPAVFGGAVAAVTDRIGIRAGSVVIPLNDPIRVAEDWSVVDNLSGGGRVSIACATGWNANDFSLAPDNYHIRHSVMYKRLEEIQNLWKGGTISVKDGNGFMKELEIFPKPIQPTLPMFITTAGNIETYISAGKLGHGILTNMLNTSPKELGVKIAAYRKALRDNGFDPTVPKMVLMLHVYIGDDLNEVYAKAKKPFMDYLGNSVDLAKASVAGTPHDMKTGDFSEQDMEDMLEFSFKRYVKNSALIGTKETCMEVLKEMAKIGVDEIACLIDFGIDYDSTMSSLEYLTELKDEYNAWVAQEAAAKGIEVKANVTSNEAVNIDEQLKQFEKTVKELADQEAAKAEKEAKSQKAAQESAAAHKDSITKTITALFEEQTAKKGDTKILVFEEEAYSYKELNAAANQLAAFLKQKHSLLPNDLVAIKLDRSEWMVISILAILKAGAAYVPIDPEYPKERIDYILSDSQCKVVLDDTLLSEFRDDQDTYPTANPALVSKPEDLAYVIYTSGSTGKPKGVMVEHRNVVAFMDNMGAKFSLKPDLIMGAATNYTFDISVLELLGTLLTGVKVLLMDKAEPDDILDLINSYKITALQITPSRLNQMLNAGDNSIAILKKLKVLLVGGEALSHHNYDRLKELKATKVYNVYGPTETTIWSTCLDVHASTTLSIGKPLTNEGVYILSEEGTLAPIGIPGEICIGGDGLARGYWNRPELTAEKFVADPFIAGEKIYKTGDIGRWLHDGSIGFMGRKDDQLKIQGYRIEPGEIETALQQHASVEQAVVIGQDDKHGEKELVAYLVCKDALNTASIREHLKKTLPSYMVPGQYIQVDAIPLLPSGKVDKNKLLEKVGIAVAIGVEYVAPRNEIEEKIAAMWQDVLGKEKIGIKDDFFSLGGHSLKATRLISMMLKEFGITMSLFTFFTNATVEGIASEVEKTKWAANELYDIDNAEKVSI